MNSMKNEKFRQWFGDSKIVDEKGNPQVMYHGTRSGVRSTFHEYKPNFFTPSASYAEGYGDAIIPVYLRITSPFDTAVDEEARRIWNEEFRQDELGLNAPEIDQGGSVPFTYADEFFAFLWEREELAETRSYDGIVVREAPDGALEKDHPGSTLAFVPLDNKQIKSAIGNSGAFDPENPDYCDSPGSAERTPRHWWEIPDDGLSL